MIENEKDGQIATRKIDPYEDEIELMDYLLVIWKWKYLIVAGTAICVIAASIISFAILNRYRVDMILAPVTINIRENGIKILTSLYKSLLGNQNDRIKFFHAKYDSDVELKKSELNSLVSKKKE